MRKSLFLALVVWYVVAGFALVCHFAHAGTVTAVRTSQVTKSLCIQIKTANLGGSGQPTIANVETDLAALNPNGIGTGISCVRDASNGNATYLNALGALGYKLDLYMGYNPATNNTGSSIISALTGFNTSGYLGAVEGLLQADAAATGCVVLSTCSYTTVGGGSAPSTNFSVSSGHLIDPTGASFIPEGTGIYDFNMAQVIQNSAGFPLSSVLPHVNYLRVMVCAGGDCSQSGSSGGSQPTSITYPAVSGYAQIASWCQSAKIVCEFEDHTSNGGTWEFSNLSGGSVNSQVPTGTLLTSITTFWAAMATQFKGNPYAWIGSLNELGSYNAPTTQGAYHQALYNAIRNTGNNNIIDFCSGAGCGSKGWLGPAGLYSGTSPYASMTNVMFFIHVYSSDTVANAQDLLTGNTTTPTPGSGGPGCYGYKCVQQIQSHDGTVPVMINEWGGTSGNATSTDGANIATAITNIQAANIGAAAFVYYNPNYTSGCPSCSGSFTQVNNGGTAGLTVGSGSNQYNLVSPWGTEVAAVLTANPSPGGNGGGGTGGTYVGSSTSPNWQVAVAAQQDLWTALGGRVPVYLWSFSTLANGASNSPAVAAATALGTSIGAITNNGNVTFFAANGNSPIANQQATVTGATGFSPIGTQGITGFGITSEGYLNGTDSGASFYGAAYPNAAYTLDSIFINRAGTGSALTQAANLTSFYSLVPDATGDDWGWFGPYSTPTVARTVATDVQNLMAIIGDAGSSANTFLPGNLTYTLSGLPSNGGSLLMQQSNFSYDLAIWVNASIYTGGVTSTAPTNGVTVTFGGTEPVVTVFDPTVGNRGAPIASYTNVSSVSVNVTDHPVIVEVGGQRMCGITLAP